MPARPCRLARVALALSSAISLAVLSHDAGAQSAKSSGLRRTLDSLSAAHHGVVGYSITNLDTGEHLEQRGNETFSTASLIKVPILVTLFDLAEQKQLTLDDPIVLTDIDKVGGAGQLQYLRAPLTLRLWDVAYLMSTLSDNTATNLVLDRIKIRRVWQKMEALGLAHTKVHSGSMTRIASVAPDSSAKYGLGVTTPNEMAQLFVLLAQGKAVSPTADSTMLSILANNEAGPVHVRHASRTQERRRGRVTHRLRGILVAGARGGLRAHEREHRHALLGGRRRERGDRPDW